MQAPSPSRFPEKLLRRFITLRGPGYSEGLMACSLGWAGNGVSGVAHVAGVLNGSGGASAPRGPAGASQLTGLSLRAKGAFSALSLGTVLPSLRHDGSWGQGLY